jgi:hypothetical protein
MKTSGNSQKSAAVSTPAAQPPDSQSGAESDVLPSHGAVRGDLLGIREALNAELGQQSDGQNDENGADGSDSDTDESARLETFDEQQTAQAAGSDEGASTDETTGEGDDGAEGEEVPGQSDAAAASDSPEAQDPNAAKPAGEGEKPKPEGFQQRINELTARSKSAEERVAKLEEQVAAYRARDEGALVPEVLDHVETPEDLAHAQQRYSSLLKWAIQNPDGGKLGERDYGPDEVRQLHAEVQSLLTDEVPKRREYLAKRAEADRDAVNFYPWLKDTTKGAGAQVQKAVQQVPALRRLPNYRMVAADAFVGQALRNSGVQVTDQLLARLAAEAKAAGAKGRPAAQPQGQAPRKATPPAAPSRAGVLPPRLPPRAAAAKAASQRLRQSQGTEDDLASSIASKL